MASISELVFFGIRAGMNLIQQGRKAYCEATIQQKLMLPLPNFDPDMSIGVARTFFRGGGNPHLARNQRLRAAFDRAERGEDLTESELQLLIDSAIEFKLLSDVNAGRISTAELRQQGLSEDALLSVVQVRQFARDNSPFPSATQRVLGTVIETGVEYFSEHSGMVDENTATGRALKGFLDSLGELDFTTDSIDSLTRNLFIAAAETIAQNTNLLTADDTAKSLIQAVSSGLVTDIQARLSDADSNLSRQEKASKWGQLVLRSVLSSAGEEALQNAQALGISGDGDQALASSIGTSLLGAILDEDSLDLSNLFTRSSLDSVAKSALAVFAETPELAGFDNAGLQNVISGVARSLADNETALSRDVLPDVVRLVVEKTGQNASLLAPDGFDDPDQIALVQAASDILSQVAQPAEDGATWSPSFSRKQLTGVLDGVLDEVVKNPNWLAYATGTKDTLLQRALQITVDTLKQVPSSRLSADTAQLVIRAVIQNVAVRQGFLEKLPDGDSEQTALAAALDMLINSTLSDDLDPKALWTLARGEVFGQIAQTAMAKLAEIGVTPLKIALVSGVIDAAAQKLGAGDAFSLQGLLDQINAIDT